MDERNRVSVPAQFRSKIEGDAAALYGYPSYINNCIEVCTQDRLLRLHRSIEQMDIFSPERDAMATAILSDAECLQLDSKGRILLTERLKLHADLDGFILFVGKGVTFEIWNPSLFDTYYKKARQYAINNKLVLKGGIDV